MDGSVAPRAGPAAEAVEAVAVLRPGSVHRRRRARPRVRAADPAGPRPQPHPPGPTPLHPAGRAAGSRAAHVARVPLARPAAAVRRALAFRRPDAHTPGGP